MVQKPWHDIPVSPGYESCFISGLLSHTPISLLWLFFYMSVFLPLQCHLLKCPPNWAIPTRISSLILRLLCWIVSICPSSSSSHSLPLSPVPQGLMLKVSFITMLPWAQACDRSWPVGGTNRRLEGRRRGRSEYSSSPLPHAFILIGLWFGNGFAPPNNTIAPKLQLSLY